MNLGEAKNVVEEEATCASLLGSPHLGNDTQVAHRPKRALERKQAKENFRPRPLLVEASTRTPKRQYTTYTSEDRGQVEQVQRQRPDRRFGRVLLSVGHLCEQRCVELFFVSVARIHQDSVLFFGSRKTIIRSRIIAHETAQSINVVAIFARDRETLTSNAEVSTKSSPAPQSTENKKAPLLPFGNPSFASARQRLSKEDTRILRNDMTHKKGLVPLNNRTTALASESASIRTYHFEGSTF